MVRYHLDTFPSISIPFRTGHHCPSGVSKKRHEEKNPIKEVVIERSVIPESTKICVTVQSYMATMHELAQGDCLSLALHPVPHTTGSRKNSNVGSVRSNIPSL